MQTIDYARGPQSTDTMTTHDADAATPDSDANDIFGIRPSIQRLQRICARQAREERGDGVVLHVCKRVFAVCGSDVVTAARIMVGLLSLRGVRRVAAPVELCQARMLHFCESNVDAIAIDVPILFPDEHKPVQALMANDDTTIDQVTFESYIALCLTRYIIGCSTSLIAHVTSATKSAIVLAPVRATDLCAHVTTYSDATDDAQRFILRTHDVSYSRRAYVAVPTIESALEPAMSVTERSAPSLHVARAQKILARWTHHIPTSEATALRDTLGEIVAHVMQDLTAVEDGLHDTLVRVHCFPAFVARHVAHEFGTHLDHHRQRIRRASNNTDAAAFLADIS